jgi:HPt (histidine-containing phosphotransfer) domain-containing protein
MRHDGATVAHPDDLGQAAEDDSRNPGAERHPVDEAVIEQLASITDGQGLSVLGELLNAFLAAVPGRLDTLHRAVAGGDAEAVAEQAHALTGSSASFGAVGMAELCRELRVVSVRGDLATAARLVEELQAEFVRVRTWLVDFRSRP